MLFPKLNEIPTSRRVIDAFRGYNHNLRIGTGEFYDMGNMTGDFYPVLSPRAPRKNGVQTQGTVQGMANLNGLCYVEDGILYYKGADGEYKESGLNLSAVGEKQIVPFGAYLVVMPDKKWANTVTDEWGDCETFFVAKSADTVRILWCEEDGTPLPNVHLKEDALEGENAYMVEGSALKKWNAEQKVWERVSPSYLRVSCTQIGESFDIGNEIYFHTRNVGDSFGAAVYRVLQKGDDFIVVEASMQTDALDVSIGADSQFEVHSLMPEMDFVFEHENRLWGCRYGLNNSGEFVNEIYASKLGDFKNWSSFQGVSTDSYIASCGTDGKWTGAIKALGYPLFFKENYLHKVYGSYPANYQIQVTPCEGVREGSEKSLAVINGVLYYHARGGVYAYDGSLPVCVSEALGNVRYQNAVAGRQGNKYYVSLKDADEDSHLFCYDTQKGFWHREDNYCAEQFCAVGDALYSIDGQDNRYIDCIGGSGEAYSAAFAWYAVTGLIGADDPDHKYISRITVRLSAALGTRVRFYAMYDSVGGWVKIGEIQGKSLHSVSLPLRIRRCDHLRLRIEGTGEAKIYSITMTMEQGSELR